MELDEQNVPSKILEEFKTSLKTVPVNQRGRALAIYNKLKIYLSRDEKTDADLEVNSKIVEKTQWDITTSMDEIIEGSRKVTEEELKSTAEFLKEDETLKEEDNDSKKMENYWLTVFKNGQILMKDQDEPIIKHLLKVDIRVEERIKEPKQPKTTTLKLFFSENEYFENTELTTVIDYEWLNIPKKSTGTEIKWKPGKIVTTRKPGAKKGKRQRNRDKKNSEKVVEKLSFFDMFADFKEEEAMPEADAENPAPSLYLVDEMCMSIGDVAGEDSLYYYLDCVHMDDLDGLEDIDEEDEFSDEEEKPKKVSRKASHKSGKSGNKSKGASRKNTKDEVKIPEQPNQEECKQN